MSVTRESNTVLITFEDETWKTAEPEIYTVTDGTNPFYSADTWQIDGKNTLRSKSISSSGTSEITIKPVLEEDGTVSFSYIVSSEANYDKLHFLIDGTEAMTDSGTSMTEFKEYSHDISAGTHEIAFRYTKDRSGTGGKDACAIGYLKFTGVTPAFEVRYLMKDFNGKVYTVQDGEVKEVPDLENAALNTKAQFQTYGFEKKPTSEQLTSLTKPVLYRWAEQSMKSMRATASAVPKAQTIKAIADMTHETITGITGITAVYAGNVTVSYSYDDSTYTDPAAMADFLQTDCSALYDGAVNKMIYFRFVIEDTDSSLTNFVISYKNP